VGSAVVGGLGEVIGIATSLLLLSFLPLVGVGSLVRAQRA